MKLGRTRRVHFVGIGGIGMSGIAELLANLGYRVSGSDARSTEATRRLQGLGVVTHEGHAAANMDAQASSASLIVVDFIAEPGGSPHRRHIGGDQNLGTSVIRADGSPRPSRLFAPRTGECRLRARPRHRPPHGHD